MPSIKKRFKVSLYLEKELYDLIVEYANKDERSFAGQALTFLKEGVAVKVIKDAAAQRLVNELMNPEQKGDMNVEETNNE